MQNEAYIALFACDCQGLGGWKLFGSSAQIDRVTREDGVGHPKDGVPRSLWKSSAVESRCRQHTLVHIEFGSVYVEDDVIILNALAELGMNLGQDKNRPHLGSIRRD